MTTYSEETAVNLTTNGQNSDDEFIPKLLKIKNYKNKKIHNNNNVVDFVSVYDRFPKYNMEMLNEWRRLKVDNVLYSLRGSTRVVCTNSSYKLRFPLFITETQFVPIFNRMSRSERRELCSEQWVAPFLTHFGGCFKHVVRIEDGLTLQDHHFSQFYANENPYVIQYGCWQKYSIFYILAIILPFCFYQAGKFESDYFKLSFLAIVSLFSIYHTNSFIRYNESDFGWYYAPVVEELHKFFFGPYLLTFSEIYVIYTQGVIVENKRLFYHLIHIPLSFLPLYFSIPLHLFLNYTQPRDRLCFSVVNVKKSIELPSFLFLLSKLIYEGRLGEINLLLLSSHYTTKLLETISDKECVEQFIMYVVKFGNNARGEFETLKKHLGKTTRRILDFSKMTKAEITDFLVDYKGSLKYGVQDLYNSKEELEEEKTEFDYKTTQVFIDEQLGVVDSEQTAFVSPIPSFEGFRFLKKFIPEWLSRSPLLSSLFSFIAVMFYSQYTSDEGIIKTYFLKGLDAVNFHGDMLETITSFIFNLTKGIIDVVKTGDIKSFFLFPRYYLANKEALDVLNCDLLNDDLPTMLVRAEKILEKALFDTNDVIKRHAGPLRAKVGEIKAQMQRYKQRSPPLVVYIGGRPGMGKTTMIDNIINFYATKTGLKVCNGSTLYLDVNLKYPNESNPNEMAWCLVINDLRPDWSQDIKNDMVPVDVLLQLIIDSVPLSFKASMIADKKKIFSNIKLVIITTNNMSYKGAYEVEKLERRFESGICVEMNIEEEGANVDTKDALKMDTISRNELTTFTFMKPNAKNFHLSFSLNPTMNKLNKIQFWEFFACKILTHDNACKLESLRQTFKCSCGLCITEHFMFDGFHKYSETCSAPENFELDQFKPVKMCACGLDVSISHSVFSKGCLGKGNLLGGIGDFGKCVTDRLIKLESNYIDDTDKKFQNSNEKIYKYNKARKFDYFKEMEKHKDDVVWTDEKRRYILINENLLTVNQCSSLDFKQIYEFFNKHYPNKEDTLRIIDRLQKYDMTIFHYDQMTLEEKINFMDSTSDGIPETEFIGPISYLVFYSQENVFVFTLFLMCVLHVTYLRFRNNFIFIFLEIFLRSEYFVACLFGSDKLKEKYRMHYFWIRAKMFCEQNAVMISMVGTGATAYILYKSFFYKNAGIEAIAPVIGNKPVDEKSMITTNHRTDFNFSEGDAINWGKVREQNSHRVDLVTRGVSAKDLARIVQSNIVKLEINSQNGLTDSGTITEVNAVYLFNNYYLMNYHYFAPHNNKSLNYKISHKGMESAYGWDDIYKIPGKDFVVVWNKNPTSSSGVYHYLPQTNNLENMYVHHIDINGKTCESKAWRRDQVNVELFDCGAPYISFFKSDVKHGDCSTVIISQDAKQNNFIAGFVCAMDVSVVNRMTHSMSISKNEIDIAVKHFEHPAVPSLLIDPTVAISKEIHKKNIFREIPSPYYQLAGSTGTTAASFKTKFEKTAIFDVASKYLSVPFSPPISLYRVENGEYIHAMKHTCIHINRQSFCYSALIKKSISKYVNYLVVNLPKIKLTALTLSEAIFGHREQGVDRINFNSSVGPILARLGCRNKYDLFVNGNNGMLQLREDIRVRVDNLINSTINGELISPVITMSYKDEIKKLSKMQNCEVRVFTSVDFIYNIVLRMYIGPILQLLMNNPKISKIFGGINSVSPQWNDMYNYMNEIDGKFIDMDFSKMDTTEKAEFLMAAALVFYKLASIYMDEQSAKIVYSLCYSLVVQTAIHQGDVIIKHGGLPSGVIVTLSFNSVINVLLMIYSYYLLVGDEKFFDEVRPCVVGDDNLSKVSDRISTKYNMSTIKPIYDMLGFVVTNASNKESEVQSFVSVENMQFLKRSFVYNAETQHYMAVLNRDSIFKSLCFQSVDAGVTPEQRLADVMFTSQLEFFLYGREYYDTFFVPFRKEIMDAAQVSFKMLSFDDVLKMYYDKTAVSMF